tara:strand:- start:1093 stop:1494 length:402 start_codon:yes stop_codon:yes gene_type:complete
MLVDTTKIEAKISDLMMSVAGDTTTYENSKAASNKLAQLDFSEPEAMSQLDILAKESKVYDATSQIDGLRKTLKSDLMIVETKFVVTNTKSLTSPAGFHPDEKVFVQTEIAIHTDTLKGLPSSNVELFAHKIN